MKAKELLRMLNEASDTAEVKVIDGELVITEPKPIEYKFKVGDKVRSRNGKPYTVTDRFLLGGEPTYNLKGAWGEASSEEKWLTLIPQDITERIKTFIDAWAWCNENGKESIVEEYEAIFHGDVDVHSDDLIAYVKLRIITCALNEGWEPTFDGDEQRYYCICGTDGEVLQAVFATKRGNATPWTLYFKTRELALYAATQFADIYTDFCGCEKGGEK